MKVRNINGTGDVICHCGGWLAHWKQFSNQRLPTYCPAVGCFQKTEVGAHVQMNSYLDNSWYIVPFCKVHSAQTGQSLDISDTVELVSANINKTCGQEQPTQKITIE